MRSMPTILLPVLLATALAAADTRVRVTVDHTSLRYQNADQVEVACVVPVGQELVVRGPLEGNWLPVIPPDDVSVWIYAELVRKGQVTRDKAQIRTGPGLNYKVAGSLDRGAPVELRGRQGDWLKIRPRFGFFLWVSRADVFATTNDVPPDSINLSPTLASGLRSALTDDTNGTTAVTDPVDTVPVPAQPEPGTSAVRLTPPPELAALPLLASPVQGSRLRYTGTLRACLSGSTAAPVQYRLTGPDRSGGIVTFCQVLAGTQLTMPAGTRVMIEGPAWLLKGESVPVVQAEHVTIVR